MGVRDSSEAPDSERGKRRRSSGVRPSTPDASCRRRHNRYDVSLPLQLAGDGEEPVHAKSANVSLGGMFIASKSKRRVGDRIRIWLELPGSVLFMTGTVIWIDERGLGVEQHLLGARDTFTLTEYLADLSSENL